MRYPKASTYSATSAYLLQKRGEKSDYLRPFLLMNLLMFLLVVPKSSAISSSEYFQDLIVAETWSCKPFNDWLIILRGSAFFFFLQKILSRKVNFLLSNLFFNPAISQSLLWRRVSFFTISFLSRLTSLLRLLICKASWSLETGLMICFFILV